MNCAKAERLLHLHRVGERTEAEQKGLELHLERCASCRAVAAEMRALEAATGRIRALEPAMEHPEALTRAIMHAVTARRAGEQASEPRFLERMMAWSSQGAVRFACASVVLVALLCSSYEAVHLATSVRSLERQMSSPREQAGLVQVAWTVPLDPLKAALGNGRRWAEVSRYIPGAGAARVTVTGNLLRAALEAVEGASDIDPATARKLFRAAQEHAQRKIQFAREGA